MSDSSIPTDVSATPDQTSVVAPDALAIGQAASTAKVSIRREAWWYLGPAFVASVAYMDPGNFATNIEGGARFGYQLLWIVVLANLMAMLFQGLSAKLGI